MGFRCDWWQYPDAPDKANGMKNQFTSELKLGIWTFRFLQKRRNTI